MSTKKLLAQVLQSYDLTLQYVGYGTLPYLPGWEHYETLKCSPSVHEYHKQEYAKYLEREEQRRRERDHVGCQANEPCEYSKYICHQTCRDSRGRAHTHK